MSDWPITDKEAAKRLCVGLRGFRTFLDERGGLYTCLPGRKIKRRMISRTQYDAIEAALVAQPVKRKCDLLAQTGPQVERLTRSAAQTASLGVRGYFRDLAMDRASNVPRAEH